MMSQASILGKWRVRFTGCTDAPAVKVSVVAFRP